MHPVGKTYTGKTFINVHTFDGKLRNQFTKKNYFETNEKKNMFIHLKSKLKLPHSSRMVDIIIRDLETGGGNFQNENNMDCSDILADIINYKELTDILPLLDEQLNDNFNLGTCPGGRTTRLLQIWKCIYN